VDVDAGLRQHEAVFRVFFLRKAPTDVLFYGGVVAVDPLPPWMPTPREGWHDGCVIVIPSWILHTKDIEH
jgi:hypothetical protein